jgi:regulator of PEP synthase PpsR (kinase-PPPase family)
VNFIAKKLNIDPSDTGPGKYKSLNKDYYSKIDSINFAIAHDDGQHSENYESADIVLLGVSRTSKSPTALYLGQRGYKVANYPVVAGLPLNIANLEKFLKDRQPMFIGLTTSAHNLSKIRASRLYMLCNEGDRASQAIVDKYTESTAIKEEISYANNIFQMLKIPVIDVTNKAIEESAAEIINLYLK